MMATLLLTFTACEYQVINPRYFLVDKKPISAAELLANPSLCARMNLKNLVLEETRSYGANHESNAPADIQISWNYKTYGQNAPDFSDEDSDLTIAYGSSLVTELTWSLPEGNTFDTYTTALSEGEGKCGVEYFYEIKHCEFGSTVADLEKKAPGKRNNRGNSYAASACGISI